MKTRMRGGIDIERRQYPVVVAVSVFVLTALLAVMFSSFSLLNTRMREQGFKELERATVDVARQIHDSVTLNYSILNALASVIESRTDQTDEKILAAMNSFKRVNPFISYFNYLTPDNRLLRNDGKYVNAWGLLDFTNEALAAPYVSDKTPSLVDPGDFVVRHAVPVNKNGMTVGLLYVVMSLNNLPNLFKTDIYDGKAAVYVIDGTSGDFLLDTWHKTLGNMNELGSRETMPGYSIDKLRADIKNGVSGHIGFTSRTRGDVLYGYYAPVGINNWSVMVSIEESVALARAQSVNRRMFYTIGFEISVLLAFLWFIVGILWKSRRKLQNIINAIPGGFAIFKVAGAGTHRVYLSESAFKTLGYASGDEAVNDTLMIDEHERVHPGDMPVLRAAVDTAIKERKPFSYDHRLITESLQVRWVNLTANPVLIDGVLYFYGIYSDITQRKTAAEHIRQSEEAYRLAANLSSANICRYDIFDSSVTAVSKIAESLPVPSRMENVPYSEIDKGNISDDTKDAYFNFYVKICNGHKFGTAIYQRRYGSEWRWVRAKFASVFRESGDPAFAVISFTDITDEKLASDELRAKAETDPLTGILNRVTFREKVNLILGNSGEGARHAMLMIDIDNFKKVNDTFGHGVGDQTLIDVTASLKSVVRHRDIVGRLGGDEFMVFLVDIASDEVAAKTAKQICTRIQKSFNAEVGVSASIGISVSPMHGGTFESMYRKADAALYHVKSFGKNDFALYNEEMTGEHTRTEIDVADNDADERE